MTDPQVAMLMMGCFVASILLGFPICFTLVAMGVGFGYYAYATPDQMSHIFDNVIFDLLVNQSYSVMKNDVLVAVPLFLFMGYIVERANIVERLFYSLNIAARFVPGAMAVAALVTCAIFATAVGIVGAVVTLMGLLAFPALLKAGYDETLSAGVICAGGCLGILIPPSIMLIVYGAISGVSVVRLYAGAMIPGFMLAGLYIAYVVIRVIINPKLAPKPSREEADIPLKELMMMLLTSFVPLAVLILSVLGAILFGLATPSEAASVGAFGSIMLAAGYRELTWDRLKQSIYLTARTSAMVCWLFVGSWTFSSVFSYLGGHMVIEEFVTGMELSP
ncbi:MAG: TRAP transporter large permease subunit, partial [Kiritimatiellota bacterium]|nr:TRAP transporter large permease subunit [Kiritimatiellota bacterium]